MNKISIKLDKNQLKADQQSRKINIHHGQLFWEEVGCVLLRVALCR
jgi:hypothetical protein